MNKKISQFEVTSKFNAEDIIPIVQEDTNKIIHGGDLNTSLSETFATNERVDSVESDITSIDNKISSNYTDLSTKITEGDQTVTNNLTSTVNSYYDILNNSIITLEKKHDNDLNQTNTAVQDWIDEIGNRSTVQQLHDALNRLTIAENTITSLAEVIANGDSSSVTPGYHTQSTATIFPLTGYYKSNDGSPLNTNDTLNQALSKLENQIEAIGDNSGSLPVIKSNEVTAPSDSSLFTSLKVDKTYLKKSGDTATGKITFLEGIQVGDTFRQGWDGQGASLYPVGSKWKMEVDDLLVRGEMTVNDLKINEIKAVGGDILVSLADIECTQVDILSDGYKCYFDDADGTKYNQFRVNDMAICQKFDGKNVKRYWRKVNEVGSNYIVLSKDICEQTSNSVPEAGDNILQLGHMYEAGEESDASIKAAADARRNAIFITSKGDNAPRISFYKNIDEFTLADADGVVRERVCIGGENTKFIGTLMQTSETGITRIPVYRGTWVQGNTYYYYDQVTHNGCLWICMNPNGTTVEPTDTDDDWQKQVDKGEPGKSSDDVAKWVEITGERLFLYDTPDYSGVPHPQELGLTANSYGMTNPTYEWKTLDDNETILSNDKILVLKYYQMPSDSKTLNIRCTVTNNDGYQYYDEVQVAKIANGAEGADGYYIDLSNYNVTIPYYNDGSAKVDLTDAYTLVYAYKGTEQIGIRSISYVTTQGSATAVIEGNKVSLTSLNSELATIRLYIVLEDNTEVYKDWYINNNSDGADGYNGQDAQYVYLSGEQYFHYSYSSTGALVCNPSSITLTADSFNILSPVYTWYWSIAGAYEWNQIANETSKTLVVSPAGVYFNGGAKEITFKCNVEGDGYSYYDFITINKVYDGESEYRATLQNENCSVTADSNGTVSSYSGATSTTRLRYGNNEITNYTLEASVTVGTGTVTVNNTNRTVACTNISTDTNVLVATISFRYNDTIVDKVDFVVTKVKSGAAGADGARAVSIYRNALEKPDRPTYGSIPTAGSNWSVDPNYNENTITWVSNGTANADGSMKTLPSGYYWSDPVPISGRNGNPGTGVSSVTAYYTTTSSASSAPSSSVTGSTTCPSQGTGIYIWIRYVTTYTDNTTSTTSWVRMTGDPGASITGPQGPSLNFRGEYSSSKTYGWYSSTNSRDVVYYVSNNVGGYYMVKNIDDDVYNKTPTNTKYWVPFTSFENVATGLLFAKEATIANWTFSNNYIKSTNGHIAFCANEADGNAAPSVQYPFLAAGNSTNGKGWDSANNIINRNARIRLYSTGIIRVGESSNSAGISGTGTSDSDIRFWAGNDDRNAAPFRVNQGGGLVATSATITGQITADSMTVSDINGWKAPGVVSACHVGGTTQLLFSVGGEQVNYSSGAGKNTITFTHTLGHQKFTAFIIPRDLNPSSSTTSSFRGWGEISSRSNTNFTMKFYDSEGTLHAAGGSDTQFDLILISWE